MGKRIRRPVEPQQTTERQYTPEELESHQLAQAEIDQFKRKLAENWDTLSDAEKEQLREWGPTDE